MTSNSSQPGSIEPGSAKPARSKAALNKLTARPRKPARITEEITESLRADIALGRIQAGEQLPNERDLASHFGVSQPTIRESIRVLEAMGLVDVRHGSGAYVTGGTHEFVASSLHTLLQIERVGVLDVVELRDILARYSAQRAVHHATDGDIDRIEEQDRALQAAGEANDPQGIVDASLAFQAAVSAAAHSPLLFVLESVLNKLLTTLEVMVFRNTGAPRDWGEWLLALAGERRRYIECLRSRDEDATVAARLAYLEGLKTRIAAVPELANLRLSDEEATRALASAGVGIYSSAL